MYYLSSCSVKFTLQQNPSAYKVSWLLSIVFDSVVFAVTLFRTYQMSRVHKIRGTYGSLANLILRDGEQSLTDPSLPY